LKPYSSVTTTQNNEISIYRDNVASPLILAQESAKIQVAFPKLDKLFFTILTERLVKNEFTEQRLKDAVGYLMDNFKYQTPTVADIISFDKKISLISQLELLDLVSDNKASIDDYYKHWICEKLFRVKKSEAEQYGLTKFLNQTK
jgi:hypothetical protein